MAYYGYWGKYDVADAGVLTVSGTTAVAWEPGTTVDIKRVILRTTTAVTVADATLTIGVRTAAGGSAVAHSQYTLPFSGSAILDVSEILVAEPDASPTVGADGNDVYASAPTLLEVNADEEFYIVSDGNPTAGAVQVYVQYQRQGNTGTRWAGVAKLARV